MRFDHVSISSVAHVDGADRVTSEELETKLSGTMRRLGLQPGFLEGVTGIRARRMWGLEFQPSQAATAAAELAIEQAGIDRSRVGIVINTSVCRDYIEPSTSCIVHSNLGLDPDCVNFDLGNACLGFLNAMDIVGNMIERGQIEYGLVVDGENSRFVVESTIARLNEPDLDEATFRENFATLTLGSGGAAMVLGRSDRIPDGHRFIGGVTSAATEHHQLCRGQVDQMQTKSKELLIAGITLAKQTYETAKRELGWNPDVVAEYILHQVSRTNTDKLARALELPTDKFMHAYVELGNVGPAAVPMVLSKAAEAGRIRPGDRVALMGIGSGLNCSMSEIIW